MAAGITPETAAAAERAPLVALRVLPTTSRKRPSPQQWPRPPSREVQTATSA